MSRAGDPLHDMLAALRDEDIDRIASAISAAHRAAAAKALERNEPKIARLHQLLAGDVFKRLREVSS